MRALVVGLGRMGAFHAAVLQDLGYTVDSVDPNPAAGATFGSIPQVEGERYDVAAIVTPPENLAACAMQLAGTPMLVEKPFATSERAARRLALHLEIARAPVCVGFVERFNPRFRELAALVAGHEITAAKFVRWSNRPSRNPSLDLMVHDVDLARCLGVPLSRAIFDARGGQAKKTRTIEVEYRNGRRSRVACVDLVDHACAPLYTPLHELWRTFLRGGDAPRPQDAIEAIRVSQRFASVPAEIASMRM